MVLVVPGCFLVSIKAQSGGQDIVNVVGVRAPTATALDIATATLAAWKATGGPLTMLPQAYSLVEVKAMSINDPDGQVHALNATGVGAKAGTLATNAACALITYGAGTRAKSTKGRMYFGPLRESDVNADGRTLAAGGDFTNAFNAFRLSLQNANTEFGIISRKNSTFSPVTTVTTQSIIATQRRRIR